MRRVFVWAHRWVGLTMTLFLVIVALTGSALAFREELDHWLNSDLFTVPVRDAPMLDPFTLREMAEALEPSASADFVPLELRPGEAYLVSLAPRTDPITGKPLELPEDQLFLDPYTGAKLGARDTANVSLGRRGLLFFLFRLHSSLALPDNVATYGQTTLGVVALVWTIDCFIAFYLTFPLRFSAAQASGTGRGWWSRWKPAWLVRRNGGAYRLNFDIHRAFGLWTWAMLFVFAWSGVFLNLRQVYVPTTSVVFDMGEMATQMNGMTGDETAKAPALDFREAYARAKAEMASLASAKGFAIEGERIFGFNRAVGEYFYLVRSSNDWSKGAETLVSLRADGSTAKRLSSLHDRTRGEAVTLWLVWLHTAAVFGLPMKIFVCTMGFVITALSVTGVYIWWKKRRARRSQRARSGRPVLERSTADV
jgi:uncharacterized iron-regulated membrane protein